MKKKIYLAYGSNMDLEQMSHRCPTGRLLGASEIHGYRLLFKGSRTGSYATIEPFEGGMVPVLVWEIGEGDERSLDRYEGYPRFYQKKRIEVSLGDTLVMGMAYIMDPSRPFGEPSEWYYDVLEGAYDRFGFDVAILEKALDDSMSESLRAAWQNAAQGELIG